MHADLVSAEGFEPTSIQLQFSEVEALSGTRTYDYIGDYTMKHHTKEMGEITI
jgi:hypothetical protein